MSRSHTGHHFATFDTHSERSNENATVIGGVNIPRTGTGLGTQEKKVLGPKQKAHTHSFFAHLHNV